MLTSGLIMDPEAHLHKHFSIDPQQINIQCINCPALSTGTDNNKCEPKFYISYFIAKRPQL